MIVLARRIGVALAATVLATSSILALVAPVAAADPVTFGTPTASSTYGTSIDFKQPVDLATRPSRVEILMQTPGSAGPGVIDVDAPQRTGPTTLSFSVSLADGHIVPNTTFTARWRVSDANGKTWVGPPVTQTYADTRVKWHTLQGDIVRVHWYEGNDDFGRRALKIGDDAVKQGSELLGVTETDPIDFFIYADQDKFYDALGPATRENVGGEAHADIRTMFALITPGEINDSWVSIVVPHELTHLVFDTATKNPYHEPPHWLNEGLAVYLSQGYDSSDRNLVENAAKDGSIMPLDGLVGAFPTTRDRFFLAYAESVSAVDWIVANKGAAALVGLIRSYAEGVSDDEAFTNALGLDTEAFQRAWLGSVGATAPVRHGPLPAPVGPLPQGWSGAAPNGSPQPGATGGPGIPATSAPGSPAGQPAASDGLGLGTFAIVGAIVVVIVLGGLALIQRNRRPKVGIPPALRSEYSGGFMPPTETPGSVQPAQAPPPPASDPWAPRPKPADPWAPSAPAAPSATDQPTTASPPAAPAESPEPRPPATPEP
jgi:hypothetical protein